jgi:inorganic pyrophosphatase
MFDFNTRIVQDKLDQGLIRVIVDIPQGSSLKIEYDRVRGLFVLDRVEPAIFAKPVNYGFLPQTKDHDGDELDALIICHEPIPTATEVLAKPIGVLNFEDDGDMDYKIVCVPHDDRNSGDSISSLDDLDNRWKQQIEFHFAHYKDLKKPGTTDVMGWGDASEAEKIIRECMERFQTEGFATD